MLRPARGLFNLKPMNEPLPFQITLKSSRKKWGLLLLMCLVFTIPSILLLQVSDEAWKLWPAIILFGGLGLPLCCFGFLKPGVLQLNTSGFEFTILWRRSSYAWTDVSDVSVINAGYGKSSTTMIAFNVFKEGPKKSGRYKTTQIQGDAYDKTPSEVADLMNAFRKRGLEMEAMKLKYRSVP